jgi:hypothetical protein
MKTTAREEALTLLQDAVWRCGLGARAPREDDVAQEIENSMPLWSFILQRVKDFSLENKHS